MRISDWSSDVCSSDLLAAASPAYIDILASPGAAADMPSHYRLQRCFGGRKDHFYDPSLCVFDRPGGCFEQEGEELEIQKDRKSVGEGQRETVRVALRGCRIRKKKNQTIN